MNRNEARSEWARQGMEGFDGSNGRTAIEAFADASRMNLETEDDYTIIKDFVTDMFHLAEEEGVDIEKCFQRIDNDLVSTTVSSSEDPFVELLASLKAYCVAKGDSELSYDVVVEAARYMACFEEEDEGIETPNFF